MSSLLSIYYLSFTYVSGIIKPNAAVKNPKHKPLLRKEKREAKNSASKAIRIEVSVIISSYEPALALDLSL